MDRKSVGNFENLLCYLPRSAGVLLHGLPDGVKEDCQEIRMIAGQPLSLTVKGDPVFLTVNGQTSRLVRSSLCMVSSADVAVTFGNICENSVHSHMNEIAQGFVMLRGGNRAGVCGTAVIEKGEVTGFRNISSVNIRIAKEVQDCSAPLTRLLMEDFKGLMIVGPPGSGKTTLLRDLCRNMASGTFGVPLRVSLIDERGELSACYKGVPQNDIGALCDTYCGIGKAQGIGMAVRCMNPQVVVLDELGSLEELEAVSAGFNCGAVMVSTIHAGSPKDLMKRPHIDKIIESRAFTYYAFLAGSDRPGEITKILKRDELYGQADGCDNIVGGAVSLQHDGAPADAAAAAAAYGVSAAAAKNRDSGPASGSTYW